MIDAQRIVVRMRELCRIDAQEVRCDQDAARGSYAPVAVTEGSAAAKSNGEVKDESLAQLSGDSRYSSDRHLREGECKHSSSRSNQMVSTNVDTCPGTRCARHTASEWSYQADWIQTVM